MSAIELQRRRATSFGEEDVELLRNRVARLERALEEKTHLLKEVNHRAKNSLQMAMALLSMQALAIDNPTVSAALNAASKRLGHLARVHELLYQRGDDLQEIDISLFLRDIGDALEQAFQRPEVSLSYDVPPLELDVGRAISVALIVGEAILNSFKYAFPPSTSGRIRVVCRREQGAIRLAVIDNGAGFPVEQRRGSLGMRLLRALGRSLGGETLVTAKAGTAVEISFPMIPTSE
ncbi:MAG: sensor histidine kinase [Sphingosinicella sp.]|uniref:sensor histidine kinase n=1 Tax=Sphingosinicella sp. TaxID=1917971 RepID=UPI0040383B0A